MEAALLEDFIDSTLVLFFCFETFTKLAFFAFCSLILALATSLRRLSAVRASRLSFFLMASSIRVAKSRSFLATKLVTFPVERSVWFSNSAMCLNLANHRPNQTKPSPPHHPPNSYRKDVVLVLQVGRTQHS